MGKCEVKCSMEMKKLGRVTAFSRGISLLSCAAVGGKQEGEGPLGHHFDEIDTDSHQPR